MISITCRAWGLIGSYIGDSNKNPKKEWLLIAFQIATTGVIAKAIQQALPYGPLAVGTTALISLGLSWPSTFKAVGFLAGKTFFHIVTAKHPSLYNGPYPVVSNCLFALTIADSLVIADLFALVPTIASETGRYGLLDYCFCKLISRE